MLYVRIRAGSRKSRNISGSSFCAQIEEELEYEICFGRVVLHDHTKKRTVPLAFSENDCLLKEVHFNVFLEFSATLN